MPWNDDDEDDPLSNRDALERADHRKGEKREELKKKVESKRSRDKLRRDVLTKQVHGSLMLQKDATTPQTFGPKTTEEKAAQQYQSTAETTAHPEELMDAEDEAKKYDDESKQEENQASPG